MTGSPRLFTCGNVAAAIAILCGVALVLLRPQPTKEPADPAEDRASLLLLELQSKLLAGVARFDLHRTLAELDQLKGFHSTPGGRRAVASIHAYLRPADTRNQAALHLPPPAARDPLDQLVAQAIGDPARLTLADKETLRKEMGWFGHLLLASSDPASAETVDSASFRAMTAASLLSLFVLLACGAGMLLLTLALVLRQQGKLPFRLEPAPAQAHLYFQSFAIYLWGMILFSILAPATGLGWSAGAIGLALLLGLIYPLLRGVSFADWRAGLGLHRGAGLFREAAAGVAAYLAMLPLLGLGLAATYLLQQLHAGSADAASPISHPIYGMIPGASPQTLALLFLVASVIGPLAEETMFRGALYGALRSVTGRVLSLLLMSFLFAAVHPQGLFAIPSLMAVAVAFGIMREWRSSLVAGAVTHGLHNGALLLAIVAMSS